MLPAFVANAVFLALLLGTAGRVAYWPAWLYLAQGLALAFLMRWAERGAPGLAAERRKPGPGVQAWDRKLLGMNAALGLLQLVLAGVEAKLHPEAWAAGWPWSVAGLVVCAASMALTLWAMRENMFFSSVVRLQADRGHTVCSSGPYAVVRHPGNAGMLLGTLGNSLLLMSWFSLVPALLAAAVLVERTRREDGFLSRELAGYPEYQQQVKFRLVPGLW